VLYRSAPKLWTSRRVSTTKRSKAAGSVGKGREGWAAGGARDGASGGATGDAGGWAAVGTGGRAEGDGGRARGAGGWAETGSLPRARGRRNSSQVPAGRLPRVQGDIRGGNRRNIGNPPTTGSPSERGSQRRQGWRSPSCPAGIGLARRSELWLAYARFEGPCKDAPLWPMP
jgi:hypothetical protein